ncbi:Dynein light chain [Collichthys lucidus]|uniref:Dynein light chain Tctex-type 1 n=1 Tax=Collichthys lucidus TaxID=240159 RepID=A0A4U5TZ30_COLLU|nr:Dynein light chain [Collichthys lucidus]
MGHAALAATDERERHRCPGVLPINLRRAAVSYLEAAAADTADVEPGTVSEQAAESVRGPVVFSADEATSSVKECIEGVIGGTEYNQSRVNQWTASIVEHSLTHLVKQGRPFKYIVNCTIMQKSGAGLHTANSCYWDTATDGSCTVRWENRTMYCVVSVFAVAVPL